MMRSGYDWQVPDLHDTHTRNWRQKERWCQWNACHGYISLWGGGYCPVICTGTIFQLEKQKLNHFSVS